MELQESMCTNAGDGADIEVSAFGTPEVRIDDESVTDLLPEKAIALLVYLADSSEPIGRSSLAGLLWSDSTEDRARNSLRVLLTRTRSVLGDALVADRNAVGFSPSSYDVVERAAADPLSRAELYVADFLDGFEPANASLFSTWAQARRARLRAQAVTDLDAHTVEAARQGDWARCRELASLTLSIDPWSEPAHRAMIESLARTVGRSQALAHYDDFARSLQSELGVLPEPDTTELVAADRVRSPAAEPADRVPLPTRPTPFFGRSAELRRLDELVAPARPVSIVGPGGIGKSRLLAEYASRRARRGDDVTFVGFDADTADLPPDASRTLAEGVLDVLGHTADGQRSAVESLHRSLEGRRGVLCLDDLDALGDVSAVVAELAAGCPGLEVVVASAASPGDHHRPRGGTRRPGRRERRRRGAPWRRALPRVGAPPGCDLRGAHDRRRHLPAARRPPARDRAGRPPLGDDTDPRRGGPDRADGGPRGPGVGPGRSSPVAARARAGIDDRARRAGGVDAGSPGVLRRTVLACRRRGRRGRCRPPR